MGLYEGVKDVANIIQKAGKIELYNRMLYRQSQALDLQDELARLKAENRELREQKNISDKIERHSSLYLTLKDDHDKIPYCTHCWDSKQKLIQVEPRSNNEHYFCPHCKHFGSLNNVTRDMNYRQENYDYDPFKSL